jgi:hypothetical protein
VEVDDATPLVFGDLGEGDADLGGERLVGEPSLAGKGPSQGDGEPAPQFGRAGVEQDGARVVVADGAQRFPRLVVIAGVPLAAGQPVAVRTSSPASAGPTAQELPVFLTVDVDGAERGRRECGEHAGVGGDGLGDALAAAQPGADELVGVRPVDLGAGRAL